MKIEKIIPVSSNTSEHVSDAKYVIIDEDEGSRKWVVYLIGIAMWFGICVYFTMKMYGNLKNTKKVVWSYRSTTRKKKSH